MAARQKEETAITFLIVFLAAIILFLIFKALSAIGTALFAPLVIIIVLLILIAAALFYQTSLVRKMAQRSLHSQKASHRKHRKGDTDSIAELERKLFGDITDTLDRLEKK
jgi:uncharacterized membrane protein YbhN (UPF0104 family)